MENIIFENKTKYGIKIYNEFLKFHQEKYNWKYTISTFIIAIMLIFCIIINFKASNYLVGILFIVAFVGLFLYRIYNPIKIIKRERKSEQIQKEKEFIFKFYKRYFVVSDKKTRNKITYWRLYKAFEDKDNFYLYINKNYAFVLEKKGFNIGNYQEFMPFIKKKILFKI